jgi:small acid-soluble spore protein H (minor)
MDVRRAKEIFDSTENISVKLDGETSVWIESVDTANGMAHVQVGASPTNVHTVSVERLMEDV